MTQRLLAIFPHPDDESYGPAGALARAESAAVFCMTRGEASSIGPQQGLTPSEVAELRTQRMHRVQEILALNELVMGDFPDGRMPRCNLAEMADAIDSVITAFEPQVVIGHDPRGVNAHPDHIAAHWAIRHALLNHPDIRFAMVAYPPEVVEQIKPRLMFPTPESEIDAVLHLSGDEVRKKEACLRVHEALVTLVGDGELLRRPPIERYDLLDEDCSPPLDDLFAELSAGGA